MPAFTLRPNGNGTYSGWGGHSAASLSDQSDLTFMNTLASETVTSSYNIDALPADAGSISGNVTWNGRMVFTGDAPTVVALFRYSGTDSTGTISPTIQPATTNHTSNYALAPGGVAWTPDIVNALEVGVTSTTGVLDFTYCYELWVTGTYIQSGEIFVSIYNLVGPLFGSSLLFPQLVSAARSLTPRVVYSPDELSTAWRQYKDKSYKFPAYA